MTAVFTSYSMIKTVEHQCTVIHTPWSYGLQRRDIKWGMLATLERNKAMTANDSDSESDMCLKEFAQVFERFERKWNRTKVLSDRGPKSTLLWFT